MLSSVDVRALERVELHTDYLDKLRAYRCVLAGCALAGVAASRNLSWCLAEGGSEMEIIMHTLLSAEEEHEWNDDEGLGDKRIKIMLMKMCASKRKRKEGRRRVIRGEMYVDEKGRRELA